MSKVRTTNARSLVASSLMLAVAATAFLTLGGAGTASARTSGSDGDVVLGATNQTSSETWITKDGGGKAFTGESPVGDGMGVVGIGGYMGVYGYTDRTDGIGVEGNSRGTGVLALGTTYGLYGRAEDANGAGVFGRNDYGNGMSGQSSSDVASGVFGENLAGGYGVAGRANSGVGVLADSSNGTALQANGTVRFSRSGVATVLAAHNSVQVSLGGLTPGSTFVLATIQANIAKLYIRGVVVSSSTNFTIYLSHAPTKTVQVAWFVLN
jgi:hypothetical protein